MAQKDAHNGWGSSAEEAGIFLFHFCTCVSRVHMIKGAAYTSFFADFKLLSHAKHCERRL